MSLTDEQRDSLSDLADRVRQHFNNIVQDVPDQSFLVGGAVRDVLLGIEANDFDFVVIGQTPESMREHGFQPIEASSFPVFHDSDHEEWALARTEEKSGEGYTGFDVFTDNVSLEDDLERRDLTCNALALDVRADGGAYQCSAGFEEAGEGWGLIDPHGGVEDIENGILRHVSDAFSEDPLRVLRAARYAARFAVPPNEDWVSDIEDPRDTMHKFGFDHGSGFTVTSETEDVMSRVAPELNRMSRDRIGMEIVKAMEQARQPSRFWEVLRDCGALAVVWPELDRATIVLAGPVEHHHEGPTFDHTQMVIDRMYQLCDARGVDGFARVRRLMMAVAHDIGKVIVADNTGGVTSDDPPTRFGGHASIGAENIERMAERMGLDPELQSVMHDACEHHMDVHDVPQMPPNELIEFLGSKVDSGPYSASAIELVDLACADEEGRLREQDDGTVSRGEFEREPFERRISAVRRAINEVDGYEALRKGLCDEHSGTENDELQQVLASCDNCRTPDKWVGQQVESMQIDVVRDVIE